MKIFEINVKNSPVSTVCAQVQEKCLKIIKNSLHIGKNNDKKIIETNHKVNISPASISCIDFVECVIFGVIKICSPSSDYHNERKFRIEFF